MAENDLVELKLTVIRESPHAYRGQRHVALLTDPENTCQVLLWLTELQARAMTSASDGNGAAVAAYEVPLRVAAWLGVAVDRIILHKWGNAPQARIEVTCAGMRFNVTTSAPVAVSLGVRAKAPVLISRELLDSIANWQQLDVQSRRQGVKNERVLAAMAEVPREKFIPDDMQIWARVDGAFPIGEQQTISQPSLVARMTELLNPGQGERILEVGGGSGYQAAILSRLAGHVCSVEILPNLVQRAARQLAELGYTNVSVQQGDGYQGWPDGAPYDGIMVTCAVPHIPEPLVKQLKEGGRMVLPVRAATGRDDLMLVTKLPGGRFEEKKIIDVSFVPMTGQHGIQPVTTDAEPAGEQLVDLTVHTVLRGTGGEDPYYQLLADRNAGRMLILSVGAFEARAIADAFLKRTNVRPQTHDLMRASFDATGVRVRQATLIGCTKGTYFARLGLEQAGEKKEVDARPSDAVAIALRSQAPVRATERLLKGCGFGGGPDGKLANEICSSLWLMAYPYDVALPNPCVLLGDWGGKGYLAVPIPKSNVADAVSGIGSAADGEYSWDGLLKEIMDAKGAKVKSVELVSVDERSSAARVTLEKEGGDFSLEVGIAEALALALRAGVPVRASEEILKAYSWRLLG